MDTMETVDGQLLDAEALTQAELMDDRERKQRQMEVEIRAKSDFDWSMTDQSNWGWAFVFNKSLHPRVGGGKSGDLAIW